MPVIDRNLFFNRCYTNIEPDILTRAEAINAKVMGADLATVNTIFADRKSPAYLSASQDHYGFMLFGMLSLRYYRASSDALLEREARLIEQLRIPLEGLYSEPSKEKFDAVVEAANQLLEEFAAGSVDPKRAREFCISFYTMVKIIRIRLGSLSFFEKTALGAFIRINEAETKLNGLLARAESVVHALDTRIREAEERTVAVTTTANVAGSTAPASADTVREAAIAVSAPPSAPAPTPTTPTPPAPAASFSDIKGTIRTHFDTQYQGILSRPPLSMEENIRYLNGVLETNYSVMGSLLAKKNELQLREKNLTEANSFIRALQDSSTDVLSLIKEHRGIYDQIISEPLDGLSALTTSVADLEALPAREVEARVPARTATATAVAKTTSAAPTSSVFSIFYRLIGAAPTATPAVVLPAPPGDVELPDDTETIRNSRGMRCKIILQYFAESYVSILRARNLESEREIETLAGILAAENESTKADFIKISKPDLAELMEENRVTKEVMTSSLTVLQIIRRNHSKLQELAVVEKKIDSFVRQHHDIGVSISLFLSNLLSNFFKTDKAGKVEQALQMKQGLQTLAARYTDEYNTAMHETLAMESIPTQIKATLRELTSESARELGRSTSITTDGNHLIAFTQFQGEYRRLVANRGPEDPDRPDTTPSAV